MEDSTHKKISAAAKMVFGGFQVIGGAVMATGHGAVGASLRQHHMMRTAMLQGGRSIKSGLKKLSDGLEDWKDS